MAKVGGVTRRLIAKGDFHEVSCAIRRDGTVPAGEFLDALGAGTWEQDPDADELPSDEQLGDRHWLLNAIVYWAKYGEPQYQGAVNSLDDGIWEFRRGAKRLSFFDTDGRGGFEPKLRIRDSIDAECDGEYWWIPYFDPDIRLGHAFPKVTQMTTGFDLASCSAVREEDLEHDSK